MIAKRIFLTAGLLMLFSSACIQTTVTRRSFSPGHQETPLPVDIINYDAYILDYRKKHFDKIQKIFDRLAKKGIHRRGAGFAVITADTEARAQLISGTDEAIPYKKQHLSGIVTTYQSATISIRTARNKSVMIQTKKNDWKVLPFDKVTYSLRLDMPLRKVADITGIRFMPVVSGVWREKKNLKDKRGKKRRDTFEYTISAPVLGISEETTVVAISTRQGEDTFSAAFETRQLPERERIIVYTLRRQNSQAGKTENS